MGCRYLSHQIHFSGRAMPYHIVAVRYVGVMATWVVARNRTESDAARMSGRKRGTLRRRQLCRQIELIFNACAVCDLSLIVPAQEACNLALFGSRRWER